MYDVVIIGCGCAGISAAIYAKRSNMKVCIIEYDTPGGQINKTSTVENYPGYKKIDGPTLAYNMFEQLQSLNVEYKYGKVTNIENYEDKKLVITDKEKIETKNIIIASGRIPKKLGIKNEDKLSDKGISWCAICDGNLYKDKNVAIIGGGNSALEESLYLGNIANHVTIINRSDKLRGDNILQEKVKNKDNIEIIYNYKPIEFIAKNNILSGINIVNNETRENKELMVDGAFIFIGYAPATEFCKDLNITDENGYIIVNDEMETNIKGIYACGDVIKKNLYQIVTATSEGAIAIVSIKNYK